MEHFISFRDLKVRYIKKGIGIPVVLLHGYNFNAGHPCYIDKPEEFKTIIKGFLKGQFLSDALYERQN